MSSAVIVYKGRTNIITVSMGFDVSADIFTSEIRAEPEMQSLLIAEWDVGFVTDGVDGELRLTLDDVITAQITASGGYMDIKRVSGGEPLPVFERPLEIVFQGTVTA
jgi:hypothetical protein